MHPCNGPTRTSQPCALRCLLLLCLAETLPDLALGQHTSLLPWALRWARSTLNKQHLALQVSLCPQQRGGGSGEVPQAAWVSHAPATPAAGPQGPWLCPEAGSRPAALPLPPPCPWRCSAAQHVQLSMSLGP